MTLRLHWLRVSRLCGWVVIALGLGPDQLGPRLEDGSMRSGMRCALGRMERLGMVSEEVVAEGKYVILRNMSQESLK